jgi:hypothetical protein
VPSGPEASAARAGLFLSKSKAVAPSCGDARLERDPGDFAVKDVSLVEPLFLEIQGLELSEPTIIVGTRMVLNGRVNRKLTISLRLTSSR